jgi:hypothetical protein
MLEVFLLIISAIKSNWNKRWTVVTSKALNTNYAGIPIYLVTQINAYCKIHNMGYMDFLVVAVKEKLERGNVGSTAEPPT